MNTGNVLYSELGTSYLEQKSHHSDQEDQSTSDLFHLSPTTKTATTPTKGFDTSSSRMPLIRKRPRPILDVTKPTALKLLLDPPDCLCILARKHRSPLPLQAADQLARRSHMGEGQRRNGSLVNDEQHEDDDGGPREGRFGTCIGAVCSDTQRLGTA